MLKLIKDAISKSVEVKEQVLQSDYMHKQIQLVAEACINSLKGGGKIVFCGNGGSFADAQHLTAEFVSKLNFDREPLASMALGTNSSNMSAIGNDYGYDKVFTRELVALCTNKDIFIPISTSGNSLNVIDAIKAAIDKGIFVYGFTGGTGGIMAELCDCIIAPSNQTEKIQEVHIMLGHILCYIVEKELFKK